MAFVLFAKNDPISRCAAQVRKCGSFPCIGQARQPSETRNGSLVAGRSRGCSLEGTNLLGYVSYVRFLTSAKRNSLAKRKPHGKYKGFSLKGPTCWRGRGGGRRTHVMHGRSRMAIDPRIRTMPGRSTSSFHRPSRHCLHQSRSAVRCSASRMKGELHSTKHRWIFLQRRCQTTPPQPICNI